MAKTTFSNVSEQTRNSSIIDDYVQGRIDFRVRQLALMFDIDDNRQDDCRQDMIAEILTAARRFDSARASWHTFVNRVLDVAVKRFTRLECQRYEYESGCPAMGYDETTDGHLVPVTDRVDDHDDFAQRDLQMDVSMVLSRMPRRLQDAAEVLKRLSPAEAARALGVTRSGMHFLMSEIRSHFRRAGLTG